MLTRPSCSLSKLWYTPGLLNRRYIEPDKVSHNSPRSRFGLGFKLDEPIEEMNKPLTSLLESNELLVGTEEESGFGHELRNASVQNAR